MKPILFLPLLLLVFYSHADINRFEVLNHKVLKEAVTMKIESIEEYEYFENYYTDLTHNDYCQILKRNFQYGINESSSYEVLDSNSNIKPDLKLHFKFIKLGTGTGRNPNNRDLVCALELIGISTTDNSKVFKAFCKRTLKNSDLKDKFQGIMLDALNDIDNKFDLLSTSKRRKSYQFYNIDCNKIDTVHYLFCRKSNSKAEKIFHNVADATFNQLCLEENYNIWKITDKSLDTLINRTKIDISKNQNLLSDELKDTLIKKGIKTLLLFKNLNSQLPLESLDEGSSDYSLNLFNPLQSSISNNTKLNEVDEAFSDMILIDVHENKRLIKTIIYGDSGDDVASHALEAIGEFKNDGGKISRCFN